MEEDLVVFGMGVYLASIANSNSDLGHVIYETWPIAVNVNVVNQTDVIRSLTYVRNVENVVGNEGRRISEPTEMKKIWKITQ